MSDKIEGVPDWWNIVKFDFADLGDKYVEASTGSVIKWPSKNRSESRVLHVERDVKIIDMSQCKVDIEFINSNTGKWDICRAEELDNIDDSDGIRVRQDHYFGWQGGECPLPAGLKVRLYYADGSSDQRPRYKDNNIWIWNTVVDKASNVIGYKVLGTADGCAYAHEMEGG